MMRVCQINWTGYVVIKCGKKDLSISKEYNPVRPREWFLVPLHVIDEVVGRIHDGSITNVVYDPQTASLVL